MEAASSKMALSVEQASARLHLMLETLQSEEVWSHNLRLLNLVYETVREPHFWRDTTRHPSLQVKDSVLPAYIIPATISLLLPLWPLILNKLSTAYAKPPQFVDSKHKSALDLENNEPTSAGKGKVSSFWPSIGKYLLHIYYFGWVQQTFIHLGNPAFLEQLLKPLCLSQAVTILITAYFFEVHHVPVILAIAGWLGLAYQHPPEIPAAIAIALLALPYACLKSSLDRGFPFAPELNGSFLIALVCNYYIPTDSTLKSYKLWDMQLWPYLIFAFFTVKQIAWSIFGDSDATIETPRAALTSLDGKLERELQPEAAGKQPATWMELISVVPSVLTICAALLITTVGAVVISGYSLSCLGWRWVIADKIATPPAFFGVGFIGALVFMVVWSISAVLEHRPADSEMPLWMLVLHQFASTAEVLGWCVTSFNAVYFVTLGVRLFRDAGQQLVQNIE